MIEILDKRELAPRSIRYDFQCMSEDVLGLPVDGVASGSTCLVIDIDKTYRFYNGKWVLLGNANRQYINGTNLFKDRTDISSPDIALADKIIAISAENMFSGCANLISVGPELTLYNDVANVAHMFDGCIRLAGIPVIYAPNNTNCEAMFKNCKALVDVTGLEIGKPLSIKEMFYNCEHLDANITIDCGNLYSDKTHKLEPDWYENALVGTNVKARFEHFVKPGTFATLATICEKGYTDDEEVEHQPLAGDYDRVTLVADFPVTYVVDEAIASAMGDEINLPNLKLNKGATNIFNRDTFDELGCYLGRVKAEITLPYKNSQNRERPADFQVMAESIKKIGYDEDANISFYGQGALFFTGSEYVEEIDISQLQINQEVQPWDEAFSDCMVVRKIKFAPNTKVGGVNVFQSCGALESIENIVGLPEATTDISHMFEGCENLVSVPALDTSEVEHMEGLFFGCANLTGQIHLDMATTTLEYGNQAEMIEGTDPDKVHFYLHNVHSSWLEQEEENHEMLLEATNYTIVNVINDEEDE